MWIVSVACSDPKCPAEEEVVVANLDEIDHLACECDCAYVSLSVAGFHPVHAAA